MKTKSFKLIVAFFLIIVVSCDEPITVVTNIVHPDGSVTRKIEMRNSENKFVAKEIQVPIDSTWTITDTCEINAKGEKTWIRRAEKLFRNIGEINLAYKNDSGYNRKVPRQADFTRRFRWFNTEYRFSESIEKLIPDGYLLKDFLNQEELNHFYSPDYLKYNREHGPDSLRYKALADSIEIKTNKWTMKNIISMWTKEFYKQISVKPDNDLTIESLKSREDEFLKIVEESDKQFDSLWAAGVILRKFIGESDALKYKTEADSAISVAISTILVDFKDYSVRIVMPGNLTGTNGFADSNKVLIWPVSGYFFLSEKYEMWAESRTPNRWAWIVSGIFLVFVLTGIIIKQRKG